MIVTMKDLIRNAILDGRYRPGDVLQQVELAAEYSVSRIPVRDALLGLEAEGLVVVEPNRGARVLLLNAAEIEELCDILIMLECDLLERAIRGANDQSIDEVLHVLRRTSLEAGRPGWAKGDWDFHRTLYQAAQRPRQLQMVAQLRTLTFIHSAQYEGLNEWAEQWSRYHEALAEAYAAGAHKAGCSVLKTHLIYARDRLIACLRD